MGISIYLNKVSLIGPTKGSVNILIISYAFEYLAPGNQDIRHCIKISQVS